MLKLLPEILTALACLAGWALIVYAAAEIVGPLAYPVGAGVFLLAVCGVRFLGVVAWYGLYSLTKGGE